jgi:ABC-type transport system substrate-binding protein
VHAPSSSIFSVKAADALGNAWATRPVMTGPFVVERHTAGSETVVVRNPNYWGPRRGSRAWSTPG